MKSIPEEGASRVSQCSEQLQRQDQEIDRLNSAVKALSERLVRVLVSDDKDEQKVETKPPQTGLTDLASELQSKNEAIMFASIALEKLCRRIEL